MGFKVDLRSLIDFNNEEFHLMCGVACQRDARQSKILSDAHRLIRVGKVIQLSLQHIFYDENVTNNVWMIQVKDTK